MADNRQRIWFSTFVLVVFCLGGVIGFRVGSHFPRGLFGPDDALQSPGPPEGSGFGGLRQGGPGPGPRRGGPPPFGRGPGGGPALPPDLFNRLSSDLELDSAQQDQVKKILDERRVRLEQVHRDARERFDTEQRELHAEIRAVLRADQQPRFDRFLERRPTGRGRGR